MAHLILSDTTFTVDIVQLEANCPRFKNVKLFPYQVRTLVSLDSFQVFVAALEGSVPEITMLNASHLLSLCQEFGFHSLLSKVSDFLSGFSAVDEEARDLASGIEEQDIQQDHELAMLRCDVNTLLSMLSDLREANSHQSAELSRQFAALSDIDDSSAAGESEIASVIRRQEESETEFSRLIGENMRRSGRIASILREEAESTVSRDQHMAALLGEQAKTNARLMQRLANVESPDSTTPAGLPVTDVNVLPGRRRICFWLFAAIVGVAGISLLRFVAL
jgi:hypothetical protein